jgi:feruloyl esterase
MLSVAALAKRLIAQHYGKPAAFSYFSGCSTGGREGMILSQRYPTVFQRHHFPATQRCAHGFSNLAIGPMDSHCLQSNCAPKDAQRETKPSRNRLQDSMTANSSGDALIKKCDANDGVADGLISDPRACDFDPEMLACKGENE